MTAEKIKKLCFIVLAALLLLTSCDTGNTEKTEKTGIDEKDENGVSNVDERSIEKAVLAEYEHNSDISYLTDLEVSDECIGLYLDAVYAKIGEIKYGDTKDTAEIKLTKYLPDYQSAASNIEKEDFYRYCGLSESEVEERFSLLDEKGVEDYYKYLTKCAVEGIIKEKKYGFYSENIIAYAERSEDGTWRMTEEY